MPCINSVGDYKNKSALGQNVQIWPAKTRQGFIHLDLKVS